MMHALKATLILCCVIGASPRVMDGQDAPDFIEGIVTTAVGEPVVSALVTVTGMRSGIARQGRTSRHGAFRLVFHEAEGAYTVLVRAIGFSPALRRVESPGRTGVMRVNVVLAATPLPLPPLSVTERIVPPSQRLESPPIGGNAQEIGRNKAFLADPTDLESLIGLVPGVSQSADGGYSVLGAGLDGNQVLLDGVRFDGTWLPPDAICGFTVASTAASPARGGFSGSLASAVSCPSSGTVRGAFRLTSANRLLSWDDPASTTPTLSRLLGTGYLSAPLPLWSGRLRFSFAGLRELSPSVSLRSATSDQLFALGLTSDALNTLLAIADSLGVPTTGPSVPSDQVRSRVTGYLHTQFSPGTATSIVLTGYGAVTDRNITGGRLLDAPSVGGHARQTQTRLQVQAASYLGRLRGEVLAALSTNATTAGPFAEGPQARVAVSAQTQSTLGTTIARLGGGMGSNQATRTIGYLRSAGSTALANEAHRIAVGQEVHIERYESTRSSGRAATYDFPSVEAFGKNAPSSFRRLLTDSRQVGRSRHVAIWFADQWRATPRLGVEGGLRFDDGRHYGDGVPDSRVDSLFDVRTTALPSYAGVSPRIGASWLVRRRDTVMVPSPAGELVAAQVLDLSSLSGLPQTNQGAGVTVFGSVGLYRGTFSTTRTASLAGARADGPELVLTCVGEAVPVPEWRGPDILPDRCRDVGGASPFGRQQHVLHTLHNAFTPPMAWRANVGVNGIMVGQWHAGASVVLSRDRRLESRIDRNFAREVRFRLEAEAGRPVYAAAGDIDPASGTPSPVAGRRVPEFGPILESRSDLTARAFQAQLDLYPPPLWNRIYFGVAYVHTVASMGFRGLDGSTAGDPTISERAPGAVPLHQLIGSTIATFGSTRFGVRLRLQSGVAFTPLVQGDINADGFANDRAYLPETGEMLTSDGRDLIDAIRQEGAGGVAACLEAQRGSIAKHNSCRGSWQVRLDLFAEIDAGRLPGLGDRLQFSARLLNAGPAILRLVGASSSLVQSGGFPDPVVFRVTGFDPVGARYSYSPNLQFGRSSLDRGSGHGFPPFQLELGAQVAVGARGRTSTLGRLGLLDGRRRILPEEAIRDRLMQRLAFPVDTILSRSDSLLLTERQRSQLQTLSAGFRATIDSLLWPVLERSGEDPGTDERGIATAVVGVLRAAQLHQVEFRRRALALLTETQVIKLGSLMWTGLSP
jgi:hypothetical protein